MDALPLALFVALFEVVDPQSAKATLLPASPLETRDVFASVNKFSEHPDPCNQRNFKHLVTVDIPHGTREILRHIEFVVAPVGKYVKGKLASGSVNQHISVVVETQLKRFPPQPCFFRLRGPIVTKVCFEYVGHNLRCCFCFSYRHLPSECTEVKPAFFYSPGTDPNPGPDAGRGPRSIVAENLGHTSLGVEGRVTPSSSEDSTYRDSANVHGESSSEALRCKRNRPRSRNRGAYARHHPSPRVVREISPIAEESLENTFPEVIQPVEVRAAQTLTPVISGDSRGQVLLKRRWLAKPPSSTRFEDLSETQARASPSIGR